jgi:DNA-directed RNA polymerase III subunit RPC8
MLARTDAVPRSDHAEQAWFWLFEASPEVAADPLLSSPDERMYLDAGEPIRLTVEDDIFEEPEPGPVQSAAVGGPGPPGANASIVTEGDDTKKTSPYRITVSCTAVHGVRDAG